jgi:acyl carrier protein
MTNDALLANATDRTMSLAKRALASHGLERDFRPEDGLADVGLTSLDLVNLMVAVEAEFDLLIPPSCITPRNFHSAAAIARVIVAVKSETGAAQDAASI